MGGSASTANTTLLKEVIDANSNVFSLPTRGLKMSESEVKSLWDSYDVDRSGILEIKEAEKFILDLLDGLERKEIEVAKQLFDDDKAILKQETSDIKALYTKLRTNRDKFVKTLDANSDGVVEYDEFAQFLDGFRVSQIKQSVK